MSMARFLATAGGALALAVIVGCGQGESNRAGPAADSPAGESVRERQVVLFLGTSLTDGYGLEREQAYPALLQEKVDSARLDGEVVNAGLSGETSAGALQRVKRWLIRQPFDVLVVETGANAMLRGSSLAALRENLEELVDTVRRAR